MPGCPCWNSEKEGKGKPGISKPRTGGSHLVKWICLEVLCDSSDLEIYMSPQDVTDHVWGKNHPCSDFHIHMSLCAKKGTHVVLAWLFNNSSLLLHNCCLSRMMPSTPQWCATLCCYSGLKICQFRPNFASCTAARMIFFHLPSASQAKVWIFSPHCKHPAYKTGGWLKRWQQPSAMRSKEKSASGRTGWKHSS